MILFIESIYLPYIGSYVPGDRVKFDDALEKQLVMSGRAKWADGSLPQVDVLLTNHDEEVNGIRVTLRDLPYGPGNDAWGLADYYPSYERLGKEANPLSIFEIGTHHGNSLISLVSGAINCRHIGWLELSSDGHERCLGNLEHFLAAQGRSAVLWADNNRGSVSNFGRADLVHIDGDHTLGGAEQDLQLCADILQPKWLLVDDYDYPEVRQAVNSFAEKYRPPEIMKRAARDHVNELAFWRNMNWGVS